MVISGDEARRLLVAAIENRSCIRSIAQLLIALIEQLGESKVQELIRHGSGSDLDEAYYLAKILCGTESNFNQPKKPPGVLSRQVERRHYSSYR